MKLGSQQNQQADRVVFSLVLVAAAGFIITALVDRQRTEYINQANAQGIIPFASRGNLVGPRKWFRGDAKAPYTLVEFGDYQCPPCRMENREVSSLLQQKAGRLSFVFRNLPLVGVHPLAMPAALTAESSKTAAEFWLAHDKLYSGDTLSNSLIYSTQRVIEEDQGKRYDNVNSSAIQVVKGDMAEASKLGIRSTPTFVLCCPDGVVRRIYSLDQVPALVPEVKLADKKQP